MVMSKSRVEIIALDGDAFYSVGTVEVTSSGEVYAIIKSNVITKISRHISGQTHVENNVIGKILKSPGPPLDDFSGLEWLHQLSLSYELLESIYNEYQLKKSNGIFCIDMRAYKEKSAPNLAIGILSEEGINEFYNSHKLNSKKQFYLFWDSNPKIGLIAFDVHPPGYWENISCVQK